MKEVSIFNNDGEENSEATESAENSGEDDASQVSPPPSTSSTEDEEDDSGSGQDAVDAAIDTVYGSSEGESESSESDDGDDLDGRDDDADEGGSLLWLGAVLIVGFAYVAGFDADDVRDWFAGGSSGTGEIPGI